MEFLGFAWNEAEKNPPTRMQSTADMPSFA
jgi:hypothetical protein